MTLAAGTRIGAYEIQSMIGAGGMGEVYRAKDPRLQRDVAIKVLPPEFARDAERMRRFEFEAQAAGRLSHPNVLAIYDVGVQAGVPYLVSDLLEGESLRERLRGGKLSVVRNIKVHS
jgi:eukaryotic-like serine/threonine-protein kinase